MKELWISTTAVTFGQKYRRWRWPWRQTKERLLAPRHPSVHSYVRLRFYRTSDPDLKQIAKQLESLGILRSRASYDLTVVWQFSSAAEAHTAIQQAADTLALLDQIGDNAARRAAAIASLPP